MKVDKGGDNRGSTEIGERGVFIHIGNFGKTIPNYPVFRHDDIIAADSKGIFLRCIDETAFVYMQIFQSVLLSFPLLYQAGRYSRATAVVSRPLPPPFRFPRVCCRHPRCGGSRSGPGFPLSRHGTAGDCRRYRRKGAPDSSLH